MEEKQIKQPILLEDISEESLLGLEVDLSQVSKKFKTEIKQFFDPKTIKTKIKETPKNFQKKTIEVSIFLYI